MMTLSGTGSSAGTAAWPQPSRGRRALCSAATRFVSSLGVLLMAAGMWQSDLAGDRADAAPAPAITRAPADAAPAMERSRPVGLTIPAIEVDTTDLVPLDVDATGALESPEDADTVGWYASGPWPGQAGPAVMGAHVDSVSGPAVFFWLRRLEPGDEVTVTRDDGTEAVFTVYAVREYDKHAFPTQRVYGPTGNRAELRLVTCGGRFERSDGYTDNLVVYAELRPPG